MERALAAEKTVEVLKAKVCAMYAGESSAIMRQLERSHKRQDALRQRRELVELRSLELGRYNEKLEGDVRDRTRAIRTILDNVTSGFLLIGPDLVVRREYTASCHELLAREVIAEASLLDLLRLESANDRMELEIAVAQVFDDILPSEVTLDVVPWRFEVEGRVLKMDARIVREDGAVTALLMTFNDISGLERAQQQAETNHVLIGILKQRSAFQLFTADAHALLASAREALVSGDQIYVRRAVHTIKGNASAFGLSRIVDLVHDVESAEVIEPSAIDTIESALRGFLETHAAVLEIAYGAHEEELYEVSETALDTLRYVAKRADTRAIERWTGRLLLKRADCAIGPLRPYVEKLAERLGKTVDFEIIGGDTMVDARAMRPVFRNLVHVLRNAIDHGIEAPDDRNGKSARGRVELRVSSSPLAWTVEVRDDGRGIDPDAVARHALQKGFVDANEYARMSSLDKAALIFVDGFSTSQFTSDVSGRGVGMSAMRQVVQELGGTLHVDSTPSTGTSVLISIPKEREASSSHRPPARASVPPAS